MITEAGTHAELIALKGEYFTLVKNQLELGD
jgi:ATP-binding cassette, subfamily B, bacterial